MVAGVLLGRYTWLLGHFRAVYMVTRVFLGAVYMITRVFLGRYTWLLGYF